MKKAGYLLTTAGIILLYQALNLFMLYKQNLYDVNMNSRRLSLPHLKSWRLLYKTNNSSTEAKSKRLLFLTMVVTWIPESIDDDLKMTSPQFDRKAMTAWECMKVNGSSNRQVPFHPDAPIHSMLPLDRLLHETSATTSICNSTSQNLRVLVILNRVTAYSLRSAIRKTYANFHRYSSGWYKKQKYNFGEHWTRMFLVGRPRSQKMWDKISKENKEFRDMVVINIDENYFSNPTIKILAALKFVSCFCPNAKYFVKSDDDNFIDMAKLEETITSVQKQVDSRYLKQFLKSLSKFPSIKDSIPFYVGASNPVLVSRDSKWKVAVEDFPDKVYPPFMKGPLYVISMSAVHSMALECPYHCIGQNPIKFEANRKKVCFWKFEDTFVGSCIKLTQKDTLFLPVGAFIWYQWRNIQSLAKDKLFRQRKRIFINNISDPQHFHAIQELYQFDQHI